jgi:hypothetical protein
MILSRVGTVPGYNPTRVRNGFTLLESVAVAMILIASVYVMLEIVFYILTVSNPFQVITGTVNSLIVIFTSVCTWISIRKIARVWFEAAHSFCRASANWQQAFQAKQTECDGLRDEIATLKKQT